MPFHHHILSFTSLLLLPAVTATAATAFFDDFESAIVGTNVVGRTPTNGWDWDIVSGGGTNAATAKVQEVTVNSVTTKAAHYVMATATDNLALRGVYELGFDSTNNIVRFKVDFYREAMGSGYEHKPSLYFSLGSGVTDLGIYAETTGEYYAMVNGSSFVGTGYFSGSGDWETVEYEINTTTNLYDVYLTRGSNSSAGALARRLIAYDLAIPAPSSSIARFHLFKNADVNNFYLDNVFGEVVPEPMAIGLAPLVLSMFFHRRRAR